jgi:hypothetical protein
MRVSDAATSKVHCATVSQPAATVVQNEGPAVQMARVEVTVTEQDHAPARSFNGASEGQLVQTDREMKDASTSDVNKIEKVKRSGDGLENSNFSTLQYIEVQLVGQPMNTVLRAVVDSGAEVSVINSKWLEGLEHRSTGKIRLRGIVGKPVEADLINLRIKLADCADSQLSFMCASCDELNEDLILTIDIVDKLYEQLNCNLLSVDNDVVNEIVDHNVVDETNGDNDIQFNDRGSDAVHNDSPCFVDVDSLDIAKTNNGRASADLLKQEQLLDESLADWWELAKFGKGGSHASAVAQGNVVRAMSASYGKSLYSTLRRNQTP